MKASIQLLIFIQVHLSESCFQEYVYFKYTCYIVSYNIYMYIAISKNIQTTFINNNKNITYQKELSN